jgi:phosphate butyryltransferase
MNFDQIIDMARSKGPKRMVVIDRGNGSFHGVLIEAHDMGLIDPIFIGGGSSLDGFPDIDVIHEPDLEKAEVKGLAMVGEKEAQIFMDPAPLDSSLLMHLNDKRNSLKKRRLISYISIFESLKGGRLTLFTDTYIHDNPNLKDKIDIVENAIDIAPMLGIERPKIAAVAHLELVNPAVTSTTDAAVLSKMSERGQFGPAVIEGPLGMDNAESAMAARHKGIESPVPGDVDIYLYPDIESAYLTTQFVCMLGRVRHASMLGGVTIPTVTLTPLDTESSCLLNIALAVMR